MSRNRNVVPAAVIAANQAAATDNANPAKPVSDALVARFTAAVTAALDVEDKGKADAKAILEPAMAQAEKTVSLASHSALETVRAALVGFPPVSEGIWKDHLRDPLRAALEAKTANANSVKTLLSRWKRVCMAVTNGHEVKADDTLNSYLTRVYPPAAGDKGDKGGRAPQAPEAAGDTIEGDYEDACLCVTGDDVEAAKLLSVVFETQAGIEAFKVWAGEYLAARATAKARKFARK